MSDQVQKGHPKGLYLLYFTEMWERFSYYGMRAIFTLYMVNALLFDKAFASKIYGSYTGLVYLTPLLGGYVADRYWGNRKSIIFGGILMAIGQFFMFMSGSNYDATTGTTFMYIGLGFLIFGNGFFKPNISTMVGQLYPEGDRRVDSAFTIFYQGINLGALLAPIVCGSLGEQYDANGSIQPAAFKYGFLAACIGMIISLIAFIILKNKFIIRPDGSAVGLAPVKTPEEKAGAKINITKVMIGLATILGLYFLFNQILGMDEIAGVIFSCCIVLPALIITDGSLTKQEKDRIWVIFIIAFFVIFFWSAFEQAGASLTFFAQEQTDRSIFGWNMPASLFQIFNAAFIVLLAPVAVSIWGYLGKKGKEPSSPLKQSMGLLFLALGYLFIAWGVSGVEPWQKVSMVWLVGLYLIHTIGELCLSPIGLSMVVKLAPARFVSLLMGVWFMSTATANKFAGELSALYPEEVKIEKQVSISPAQLQLLSSSLIPNEVLTGEPKGVYALPVVNLESTDKSISTLAPAGESRLEVSRYHLKLIKGANGKFVSGAVTADGQFLVANRDNEVVDIWNLKPEKPTFLGMKVENLYDFFMIFFWMAGVAAVLLFSIHRWLMKMMHGKG